MPEPVVDLFESVQVANQKADGSFLAVRSGEFPLQMDRQGACVGYIGQMIGDRRFFRRLRDGGVESQSCHQAEPALVDRVGSRLQRPPHLDTGQTRVNDYHHPENYLLPEDGDT